jgi:uncharacterized protein YegL
LIPSNCYVINYHYNHSMANNYREKYLHHLKAVHGVQVQAFPLYHQVPTGVKLEVPVLFRIMIGDHSHVVDRKPVHVCLVLDRSGSMAGVPLRDCKQAIKHLISQLDGEDVVSLVIYDDAVDTIFKEKKASDLMSLTPQIDEIKERGWTNISGGLQEAAKILNESTTAKNHQKLVFLFSDGVANKGIVNLDDLGSQMTQWVEKDQIRFSSYGIGSDYNETWMRSIARGGEGNYFFIDKTENIASYVEKGLAGFTSIIGEQANFNVKGLNGHVLTSFQGDKSMETFELGARNNAESEDVLEYNLKFNPIKGLENLASTQGHMNIRFVPNLQVKDLEKDPEVACYLVITECGHLNLKVDEAIKKSDKVEAIKIKKEIIAKYEAVLELDKLGIIGAMVEKEKKALEMMIKEGVESAKSVKFQNCCSSMAYQSMGAAAGGAVSTRESNWEKKKSKKVVQDNDAGFSLFD